MLIAPVVIAASVPLIYLYFVHWLDLYGSDRPKWIVVALVWGVIASGLAYLVNHPMVDIVGRPFVVGRSAPFVEEILKSLILIYLVSRAEFTYFVDGAIYGFAAGTGFAIAENMNYLFKYDPSAGMLVAVIRVFSSALLHGTATGITGTALGRFRFEQGKGRILSLVLGLLAAIGLHLSFNNIGLSSTDNTGVYILVGVGLCGLALIAAFILWGLRDEKRWLRDTLNLKLGVSEQETNLVEDMADLDELLAPIEKRFGKKKREQVSGFLHLEAQLGLKREVQEKTTDARRRSELESQIKAMEKSLDERRRAVGVYVMTYVRSILPPTQWSIWVRAGQALETGRMFGRTAMWQTLVTRTESSGRPEPGMYARLNAEVLAREQAKSLTPAHVEALPEELRHCMLWVMQREGVAVHHVTAGLGREEAEAHALLSRLVERGMLRRTEVNGEQRFQSRVKKNGKDAPQPNLWQGLHGQLQKSTG